jgi:hypothetical protein
MKKREAIRLHSFTSRLPEALIQRLKLRAVRDRTNVQTLVAEALSAYLKAPKGKEAHSDETK